MMPILRRSTGARALVAPALVALALVALALVAMPGLAGAQAAAAPRDSVPARAPTITLLVGASAASVRHDTRPVVRIVLTGAVDSVRRTLRLGLPETVTPGQTYRNVDVALELLATLDGRCLVQRLGAAPADSSAAAACARLDARTTTPGTGTNGAPRAEPNAARP